MAEQPNGAADRPPVAGQIMAEDLGLPLRDREQAGAGPEEAGLAGAVGPLEQDDLPAGHVEVDAGEGGEASEESDGGPEADGWAHGDVSNATGEDDGSSMQGAGRRRLVLDWRLVARGIGKTLIGTGVIVLLFVAYQLWGTGIAEARSQHDLKKAFHAQVARPSVYLLA